MGNEHSDQQKLEQRIREIGVKAELIAKELGEGTNSTDYRYTNGELDVSILGPGKVILITQKDRRVYTSHRLPGQDNPMYSTGEWEKNLDLLYERAKINCEKRKEAQRMIRSTCPPELPEQPGNEGNVHGAGFIEYLRTALQRVVGFGKRGK